MLGAISETYKLIAAWLLVPVFSMVALLVCLGVKSTEIECFLSTHKDILTSVGTVVLVSSLALGAAVVSSRSAEVAQKAQRDLSAELTLSEFRQNWINELRRDLAEMVASSYEISEKSGQEDKANERQTKLKEIKNVESRVRMRLNPSEAAREERELEQEIIKLIRFHEVQKYDEEVSQREIVANLGAKFLKTQWSELTDNLNTLKSGKPNA